MPGAAQPFFACPVVLSGTTSPHTPPTGSPIVPGGQSKVFIEGQLAIVANDVCTCAGPEGGPNAVLQGSLKVKFGGLPAARMGDPCRHPGSMIIRGSNKVIIG
jgi:uncharacterized Zn-binding protein involved in type VI secretion